MRRSAGEGNGSTLTVRSGSHCATQIQAPPVSVALTSNPGRTCPQDSDPTRVGEFPRQASAIPYRSVRSCGCRACGRSDLLGLIPVHESMPHDSSLRPRWPPARCWPQARLRQLWRADAAAAGAAESGADGAGVSGALANRSFAAAGARYCSGPGSHASHRGFRNHRPDPLQRGGAGRLSESRR